MTTTNNKRDANGEVFVNGTPVHVTNAGAVARYTRLASMSEVSREADEASGYECDNALAFEGNLTAAVVEAEVSQVLAFLANKPWWTPSVHSKKRTSISETLIYG